jgi:multiple sugar transport system substrate-binding protein
MTEGTKGMKKWRLWGSIMLCVVLVVAAGCSGNSNDKKGNQSAEVSFSYWGGDFDKTRMELIYAEFQKVHPEITVKLIQIPGDGYEQKILATMAAGAPYDVIQLAETFYSYAAKGTLEDLTPYMAQDNIQASDYYDAAINAYSYDGKVMAMPMRMGTMIMLYNKTLFDKHGLDYPSTDWTWTEFLNAAQKITNKDDSVFGLDWVGSWWASYLTWVHSFGGGLLSDDRTAFTLDSAESKKGLQFIQDLIWKHNVTPQSNQWLQGVDMWTSGKMGMKIDGPWHILSSQANIKDFEWDIAPVPKGIVEATPLFSNAFAIPKLSSNKEAAWKVIQFWTGEVGQGILADEHGEIPPLKSVAESDRYLDLGDLPPANFPSQITSAGRAFAPQATIKWEEINKAADTYVGQILNEQRNIDDAMADMKTEVERLLEEAKQLEQ